MLRPFAAAVFVLTVGACAQPTGPEHQISAERLFNQYCARCHGVDGIPTKDAPTASSFASAAVVERLSDEKIKGIIRKGQGQMPGFGDRFTEATLQVFVAYVRTLPEGGGGAPVGASAP